MIKEKYYGVNIILKKYNLSDTNERLEAIRESIDELSPWLYFFKKDSFEIDNKEWMKQNQKNWMDGIEYSFKIVSKNRDEFLGEVRLNHFNKNHNFCNLTYWVRSSAVGHGVITAASKIIIRAAFEDLKMARVEIFMSVKNPGSKRIAEKVGAKFEGVMRNRIKRGNEMQDAYLYSVLPEDVGIEI